MSQIPLLCRQAQAALSAMLDQEEPGMDSELLSTHLVSCSGCRTWSAAAQKAMRGVRLQVVQVPDLTESILSAVAADSRIGVSAELVRGQRRVLQVALAISACAQLLLALPSLLVAPTVAGARIEWEMGSLAVAVAIGYLYAARNPHRARAFVPVATVLSLCLLMIGVRDVLINPGMLAHNLGHLLAFVQLGLLVALTRLIPETHQPWFSRHGLKSTFPQSSDTQQIARIAQ